MTRLLTRRTFRTVIGLLALVEAIFLAESFTTILENAIRDGGSVFDVLRLLLLKSPEVVDFALPIVLMLGLFFAITAARDDNELVICAAAGVSWRRVPIFAVGVGMLGLCVSLLFAGVMTPVASYMFRLSLYELKVQRIIEEITTPSQRKAMRTIDGRTIIATPSTEVGAERGNLFIYQPEGRDGWRVSQANDWTVIGPDDAGAYGVEMRGFRESTGAPTGKPDAESGATQGTEIVRDLFPGSKISISTLSMGFRLEDLIQKADRARRGSEVLVLWKAAELLKSDGDVSLSRRLGEILARGILCPIAALLAVAAAAFSASAVGRWLALPLATVGVLAGDIVARALMGDAAASSGIVFWLTLGSVAGVGLGAPLAYVLWRGEVLIAPRRGRA